MTDTEYVNASIVFACIAAHEAARAILATDPDDADRICELANAAQPYGIVRVARLIDRRGPIVEWDDLFRAAYLAVNDALIATNRARTLRWATVNAEAVAVDARRAARLCAGYYA